MLKIKLLLTVLTITLLTGCCWIDYSETIKEVAEPMLKELDTFYKKNQRLPNIQERNVLLKKIGCKLDSEVCIKGWNRILIIESRTDSYGDYSMELEYKKNSCYFGIDKDGTIDEIHCSQPSCINLSH